MWFLFDSPKLFYPRLAAGSRSALPGFHKVIYLCRGHYSGVSGGDVLSRISKPQRIQATQSQAKAMGITIAVIAILNKTLLSYSLFQQNVC